MLPNPKKKSETPKESHPSAAADLSEKHPYYYDDATGYEKYNPDLDKFDEADDDFPDRPATKKQRRDEK